MKSALPICFVLFMCVLILSACDSSEGHPADSEHIHSFSEWVTTKSATCTVDGLKERDCICGEIQTSTIPVISHQASAWITDKVATCTETGSKHTECTACGTTISTEAIAVTSHIAGTWITDKVATCTETGSKHTECAVCQNLMTETIAALGHSFNTSSSCSKCGVMSLDMTSKEIESSKTVSTMKSSVFEYSDEFEIKISFKDEKANSVQIPVFVDIRIVDDNGLVLYNKTLVKKASQSLISVDYEKLVTGYSSAGTLYYNVYNDYLSFEENSYYLTKLPWTVDIQLPSLFQIRTRYSWDGVEILSKCKITNITYKVAGDITRFYFSGEKVYDRDGPNKSFMCIVGWKLYDEAGNLVTSGTLYTPPLTTGETFEDKEVSILNKIKEGKSYKLVLLDVDNF